MLKIKSNTNEFTIIFFWEDWKENKCWKIICSTLSVQLQRRTFLCSSPLFLSASAPLSSFLLFWSVPLFCFSPLFLFSFGALLSASASLTFLQPSLFSFLLVALYFSAQNTFFFSPNVFQPKNTFSAQNVFASVQNFFQFSPKRFFLVSVQPLFSSSFFCFILFWFSPLFSLSAPPFFLFFSSVYPRPNVLFSCFTSLLFE